MGLETDQALVMISTVAGCLQTLIDTHAFARVDIQQRIKEGFAAAQRAIIEWPGMCNRYFVKDRREQFKAYIFATPDEGFSAGALVKMCDRVLIDLLERNNGLSRKVSLLVPIHAAVQDVDFFCDATGENFPAYEKSDQLLNELYRIIGFKTEVV